VSPLRIATVAAAGLAAAFLAASPASAGRPPAEVEGAPATPHLRLAVIPFSPRGASAQAWLRLRPFIDAALEAQGFTVVSGEAVENHMREHRLRDASILTHDEIAGLAAEVKADRVLLGSLYRLEDGKEPRASFSGRLIDPARLDIEAINVTILEGDSLLGPLGMGGPITQDRLLEEASDRFAASLAAGLRGEPALAEIKPLLRGGLFAPDPAAYLVPRINERRIRRIAVLPFRNQTRHLGAGQAAADMFSWCLQASGQVSLLDAGDATRRLLLRGWRTGAPVGRAEVLALGEDPGVDAVLMGDVDRWTVNDSGGSVPPEIAFTVRLLDASSGEILWAAEHERRGDQTSTIYGIGNARLSEALLARSAWEALKPLLESMKVPIVPSKGETRP